jgi:rubrerythrin
MPATHVAIQTTKDNLLIAFEEEVNMAARHAAYAVRANADGLPDVAILFRAVARAAEIRAENHGRVLRECGGDTECVIHAFTVRKSLQNLESVLGCERYEIETMYPEFLENSVPETDANAIHTFRCALEAGKERLGLYEKAIAVAESNVAGPWISAKHLYVCPACGYISESLDEHVVCSMRSSPEIFELVR